MTSASHGSRSNASHGHEHGPRNGHAHASTTVRALWIALALTAGFAGVEAIGGWLAGSLALISDAGHMVTDAASFVVALIAAAVARRPPSRRASYGYARAEVLAAFVNALAMLALVVWIAVEAVQRLLAPLPVAAPVVMAVAVAGLAINILVAWLLARAGGGINARGALLHVFGDLLGSVAALVAGAVIYATGWTPIDPILSLAVALLILRSTLELLRQSTGVLMEGVPAHLSYEAIGRALAGIAGVTGRPRPARLAHGRGARRALRARDACRRIRVAARARDGATIARARLRHRTRDTAAVVARAAAERAGHSARAGGAWRSGRGPPPALTRVKWRGRGLPPESTSGPINRPWPCPASPPGAS